MGPFLILAEAQGFEPWNPFGLPVFKTGAIDHSAKLPVRLLGGVVAKQQLGLYANFR